MYLSRNQYKLIILLLIFFFVFSLLVTSAQANTIVVINSGLWEDVYSGIMYANLNNLAFDFLISDAQVVYKPKELNAYTNAIYIESTENPLVYAYSFDLEKQGLTVTNMQFAGSINLDLAKSLPTKNFIILDPAYPHNAISVVPYAVLTQSYVLFLDEQSVEQVYSFLKEHGVEKLLMYGFLDPDLKEQFNEFNPEQIDLGDKFSNNIAMVKKYKDVKHTEQVIFTSGDFIEKQFMRGAQPILFIGEKDIPESIINYLKESDLYVAEVVGNELTAAATKVKRILEASGEEFFTFVRFGQGTTLQGAENIKKIAALDMYYIPKGTLNITISEINYNRAAKQLEVTYDNLGELNIHLKSTVKILIDNKRVKIFGDKEAFFIPAAQQKIIGYSVDLSEYEPLDSKEKKAEVLTQYGEGFKALDSVFEGTYPFAITEINDSSAVDAISLSYSADLYKQLIPWAVKERKLTLMVKNLGSSKVYYLPTILLKQKGVETSYTAEAISFLEPGSQANTPFMVDLKHINVSQPAKIDMLYGAQEKLLIKRQQKQLYLTPTYWTDIIILTVVVIVIILGLLMLIFKIKKFKLKRKK